MKILFLTDNPITKPVFNFLKEREIVVTEGDADFVVSYNYKTIIKKPFIKKHKGRIINLHISYLPYNRGADPVFWSIYDQTPSGVTIHQIDEGIDTGDILLQEEVPLNEQMSLWQAYNYLHFRIQRLFMNNWPLLRDGKIAPRKQKGKGTYHLKKDFYDLKIMYLTK